MRLFTSVGFEAPLRFVKVYDAITPGWFVITRFMRDNGEPLELGREPLEGFPSEMLIAQCMLVC